MPKEQKKYTFESLLGKGELLLRALYLTIIISVVAVLSNFVMTYYFYLLENSDNFDTSKLESIFGIDQYISIANVITVLFSSILFMVFYYRAYANYKALGNETPTSAGWAVGFFFIPILNLFKPYQFMKQIWSLRVENNNREYTKGHGIVLAWWLTYLFSQFIYDIGSIFLNEKYGMVNELLGYFIFGIAGVFEVVYLVLLFKIIPVIIEANEVAYEKFKIEKEKEKHAKADDQPPMYKEMMP